MKKLNNIRIMDKKQLACIIFSGGVVLLGAYLNIILAVVIACLLCCQWYFLIVYHNLVPNIFRDGQRNYQNIWIGSQYVPKDKREENTLYCLAYRRSLKVDICVLERMYSFLSALGTIHIYYNLGIDKVEEIQPVDIYYLHGVTMNELGIKHQRLRYYFPFFMNPLYAVGYFLWEKVNVCVCKRKCIKDADKIVNYLEYISDFADKRKLDLIIDVHGTKKEIKKIEGMLSAGCREKIIFRIEDEEES